MAMVINTNIMSINAQNNLRTSQGDMNTAMERLSSGKRVNSAADDAAGLAIINRFTSQERGLNMAIRNANDGISMIQTAEGALDETTNILQRMRELAIQSANGIYSDANRATLNAEVVQLKEELTRIAETTSFNGLKILDGTLGDLDLQVGAESGEQIRVNLGSGFDAASLGASDGGVNSGSYTLAQAVSGGFSGTSGALATLDAGDLIINDVDIPAAVSGSDTVSTSDNASSSISIAAAINSVSDETGVVAEASNAISVVSVDAATDDIASGDLTINGVNIGAVTLTDNNVDTQAGELVDAINAQTGSTGVSASYVTGTDTLTLTAIDGRNIQLTTDADAAAINDLLGIANSTDVTYSGVVTLRSNEAIDIAGNDPSSLGFTSGATPANEETALFDGTFQTLSTGDLTINGYSVELSATALAADLSNAQDTASAFHIASGINSTDGLKSEVVATALTVANLGAISAFDASSDNFSITVNGQAVAFDQNIQTDDANGYLVGTLNNVFAQAATTDEEYGLVASLNEDGELIITADDGRNIDILVADASDTATSGPFANLETAVATDTTVIAKGTITLTAKEGFSVGEIGGDKRTLAGIQSGGDSIAEIDISTQSGAQAALDVVDRALDYIADARGDLGAASNRLSFTINNLSSVVENSAAARSRVQDADFAMESAALARAQVLQQAGTAMLAQANAAPQSVLSLLQ